MTPDPPSDSQLKSQELNQPATSEAKNSVLAIKQDAGTVKQPSELTENQRKRLIYWAPKRQKLIRSVWCGKTSPRTAIKFQCLDCCGEDMDAVRKCSDDACPLHAFRPK